MVEFEGAVGYGDVRLIQGEGSAIFIGAKVAYGNIIEGGGRIVDTNGGTVADRLAVVRQIKMGKSQLAAVTGSQIKCIISAGEADSRWQICITFQGQRFTTLDNQFKAVTGKCLPLQRAVELNSNRVRGITVSEQRKGFLERQGISRVVAVGCRYPI